jgi:hypothetical protein
MRLESMQPPGVHLTVRPGYLCKQGVIATGKELQAMAKASNTSDSAYNFCVSQVMFSLALSGDSGMLATLFNGLPFSIT